MGERLEVTVWMNYPSLYQTSLFQSLSQICDLKVFYYEHTPRSRRELGWKSEDSVGSHVLRRQISNLVADDRSSIHIVPCAPGQAAVREVLISLLRNKGRFIFWREPAWGGRRKLSNRLSYRLVSLVSNRYALGCFAIGKMGIDEYTSWGIDPSRVAMIPYARAFSDSPDNRPDCSAFSDGYLTFGFSGALNQRKAVDILLKAFAVVHKRSTVNVRLLIVGHDQSNGAYSKLAAELGISGDVMFVGAVPAEGVQSVMGAADVVVLPSRFDGWGVSLQEGALLGKALIGSNTTGAAYHLIAPGYTGVRCKSGDVNSLINAMLLYAMNEHLVPLHGQRSQTLAMKFVPDQVARNIDEICRAWLGVNSGHVS